MPEMAQESRYDFEGYRLPPSAVDVETTVLGGILLAGDALYEVSDRLTPDSFFDARHRLIYAAMIELSASSTPVDMLSVKDRLHKTGKLEQAGGLEFLSRLTDTLPSVANIKTHAAILREKNLVRRTIAAGQRMVGEGFQDPADVEAFLDKAQADVLAIGQDAGTKGHEALSMVLTRTIQDLSDRAENPDGHIGVPTRFHDLDAMTHGLHPSDLVILAARPAMGKTALALNILANAAQAGKTVAMFSLEMSNPQLAGRLLSVASGVNMQRFRRGDLSQDEWMRISEALNRLNRYPVYLDDTPRMTPSQIRAKCRQIKAQAKALDLVVVDYIQLMSLPASEGRFGNRENEIAHISRSLKMLAKELDVPVLALSQLNRELEKREDKRPRMSDLRESGAIEQDADIILFLHRPIVYEPKSLERLNDAEVIVAKHRNGPTGNVPLTFNREIVRFDNPEGVQPAYISNDDEDDEFGGFLDD